MRIITIITSAADIDLISNISDGNGDVGFLIPIAPDRILPKNINAINLLSIIGEHHENKHKANALADKILSNELEMLGMLQLTIFKEIIVNHFMISFQMLYLNEYLLKLGFTQCEFLSNSLFSTSLKEIVKNIDSPLIVLIPKCQRYSHARKVIKRAIKSLLSYNDLRKEVKRLFNIIDPFHRREMFLNYFRKIKITKGEPWFYSTAETFTNIGLLYEPCFKKSFNYLIEDDLTGGKPLNSINRNFMNLYKFSASEHIPSKDAIYTVSTNIIDFLNAKKLIFDDVIVFKNFMLGYWFHLFISKLLAQGLFYNNLFEHWIKEVEPSMLVVGNHVSEGYALYKAKDKNVRTVLLQHGLVADTYHFTKELPVDFFIVRGNFWCEILDPDVRLRTIVMNPECIKKINSIINKTRIKPYIVFCTAPFHAPLGISIDIIPILTALIETVYANDAELIIRVHPLERISEYKDLISKILIKLFITLPVQYSQSEPLDNILNNASACVLFCSTVFLDCIKLSVPIISFDWIDYSYKKWLKPYTIVNFANRISDFKLLLRNALSNSLIFPEKVDVRFFLAKTPLVEAKALLNMKLCYEY